MRNFIIHKSSCIFARKGDNDKPCAAAKWDEDKKEWTINIHDLSSLMELVEETGNSLIISKEYLEVYDDYRE